MGSSMGGVTALAAVGRARGRTPAGRRFRPGCAGRRHRSAAAADRRARRGVGAARARDRGREPDADAVRHAASPTGRSGGSGGPPARTRARRSRRDRAAPRGRAAAAHPRRRRRDRPVARCAAPGRPRACRDARRLVVEGADHGQGHAVDPAAYEAAVTDHLRLGVRDDPIVAGTRRTATLYCWSRRRRGSGERARHGVAPIREVGWPARSSSSMTTRVSSDSSSTPSSRRGTRSSSRPMAPRDSRCGRRSPRR